jgi:hypothetical protein
VGVPCGELCATSTYCALGLAGDTETAEMNKQSPSSPFHQGTEEDKLARSFCHLQLCSEGPLCTGGNSRSHHRSGLWHMGAEQWKKENNQAKACRKSAWKTRVDWWHLQTFATGHCNSLAL